VTPEKTENWRRWFPAALIAAFPAVCWSYDYPTVDRVEYVQDCMRSHSSRPPYEMLYKCSCAVDFIAKQLPYDDFVELSTAAKAAPIAGERGAVVRDSAATQQMAKNYRDVLSQANKSCLIEP
jgi:hypothetical protein